jgi:hypothetical protein
LIEDDETIVKSMVVLTFGGVVGGASFSWLIFESFYDNLFGEFKTLIIIFLIGGLAIGLISARDKLKIFRFYLREIWFLPSFSSKFFRLRGLMFSSIAYKYWDCGWNEALGPKGARSELNELANKLDSINHLRFKNILFLRFFILVVLLLLLYCCSLYKA